MNTLEKMPNIGKVLAAQLTQCGIVNADDLKTRGSVPALAFLAANGFDVCQSKLYALEGAIRGVRWHNIPAGERKALSQDYTDLTGQKLL